MRLTEAEFIQGLTRVYAQRNGMALLEQSDGACGFLDSGSNFWIQPVKTHPCSDFPNRWNSPVFEKLC